MLGVQKLKNDFRSYEKAGFLAEGIFRDMVKLDGLYHDVIYMSKLNPEEAY